MPARFDPHLGSTRSATCRDVGRTLARLGTDAGSTRSALWHDVVRTVERVGFSK